MVTKTQADAVEVASRLRPVLLRLSRELRREAQAFGVTGGQATLLAQIEARGSVGLGELAAGEGVSAAAMSKHVDRLEAAGLVRREPNPQDGRGTLAVITETGRDVAAKATAEFNAARFGLGALRLDELGEIFAVLRRLRLDANDFAED